MSYRVKEETTTHLPKTEHFRGMDYPIFPDDELEKSEDGTYYKVGPGLGISGIVLSDDQVEEYTEERSWVF